MSVAWHPSSFAMAFSLADVADSAFAGMTQLQALDMSHNSIRRVTERTFAGARQLEELNLSANPVGMVDVGIGR